MSELILNTALPPELLTGLSGGAPTTALPAPRPPADGSTPANPFAALLAGFLQGSQPSAQAVGADPSLDQRPDSSADPLTLLALPGSVAPLPAVPGTSTDNGSTAGRTLPVTGNTLPATPALPRPPASELPVAHADVTPLDPKSVPAESRPRISLADLALSRPLETAPASAAAIASAAVIEGATTDPVALAPAGRSLPQKGTRTHSPASTAESLPALSVTQSLTENVDAELLTIGVDEPARRLATTDFLRGTFTPSPGTEFIAGQLAAFAANNDGGPGSPGTPPLTGPGGPDSASTALLSRLGSTTLPALQPLAGNQSFAGGLADRLLTLGGTGAHTARLKLHPEHLGELDVEIQIDDGSAQVWFGTTTSQARDAIEASLPRLKELFADQGLALTRTQVDSGNGQPGSQNPDQQRRMAAGAPFETNLPWRTRARAGSSPLAGLLPATRPSTRLVDAWA